MRDLELENSVSRLLDIFKEERIKKGLSLGALAKKTGLHVSTISLLESKKRTPTVLVALKIAKALELKLPFLLTKALK